MFLNFFIFIAASYVLITWLLPLLIAWYLRKRFKARITISRLGIFYPKLYEVNIVKSDINIHIEEVGIRSSFFNSELTKLVTLVVKDVRINQDYAHKEESNPLGANTWDIQGKKIPVIIPTFAQFMAIHVYNISAMLLQRGTPDWLVHATAHELHLDGSIVQNAKTLLVNVNMLEASAKVLRHSEGESSSDACLGEVNFGITMEAMLFAQGPLSFEKLSIAIGQNSSIITEGLYTFIQQNQHQKSRQNESVSFKQLVPILPKSFLLTIDNSTLRAIKSNSRTDFSSSLSRFFMNYRVANGAEVQQNMAPVHCSFSMDDLQIQNNLEQLLLMKRLKLQCKVDNTGIDLDFYLNTMNISYDHETIFNWVSFNFLQQQAQISSKSEPIESKIQQKDLLTSLLNRYSINGFAELQNITAFVKFNTYTSSASLNCAKFQLKQSPQMHLHPKYNSEFLNLFFKNRQWQLETALESICWSFKDCTVDPNIKRKLHFWGTPFYLGLVQIKLGTQSKGVLELEAFFEYMQFEWSTYLAEYIVIAFECLRNYAENMHRTLQKQPTYFWTTEFKVHFHHCNCFFTTTLSNEYIITRLNGIDYEKDAKSAVIHLQELKVSTVTSTHDYYNCIRGDDINEHMIYIARARVNWEKQTHLHLLQQISINWSPNIHLKVMDLTKEINDFLTIFSHKQEKHERKNAAMSFSVLGDFAFNIQMSQQHKVKLTLEALDCSCTDEGLTLTNPGCLIAIDGADIFDIQGVYVKPVANDESIRLERMENESFDLDWNTTWGVNVDLLKIIFPYEHNYADAVHNEFISIYKWLKIIHGHKKVPFTTESPLPKDLIINVKEFLFEMSDDPFEVKLRDNFELLADEYSESLKRKKRLADKIDELLKKHPRLPAGKVEELYASLKEKTSQIYIQRNKQMLETSAPRTRLFAWTVLNAEIMILADYSIHGTENVVRTMREIDAESPWPEEEPEFNTLWCRVVSMRCEEWKFQLRDFPQPLLIIRQWYICGQLVGAEQLAPKRATRDVVIDLGEPFNSICIQRSLLPLKFYHDFNCEIQYFSYAFGPCWEPVIAQCNLSFEQIFAPSKDPSPPLPFWDKMRLLMHGRLTMEVQQLTVLLHASLDPYNTTEEMELTWNKVIMDWTNGKFVYKGDFNIFVRTASKYDDCQLLHIPNLKLIIGIEWICLGDPKDHHGVIQCAPNKIPEYSSNQVHDSFRAFRSQNVNLSISLETKVRPDSKTSDVPLLSLFGSTLRWFENLKLILQGVTRPTRRGKIFNNLRPRKLQLSRHYKRIHLLLTLHKFQVCYWMSFAMQRGCELLGGHLGSSSEHTLALVPVEDGLKHRPKAEWSIMYVTSELLDSQIWLKSALQEGDVEVISAKQPVEKLYCLSVAKVSYGREPREHERNKDTPTHRLVVYDLKGAWTQSNRNVALSLFDTFMKNKQMKKNLSTEVLKASRKESGGTPLKTRRNTMESGSTPPMQVIGGVQEAHTLLSKFESGQAVNMLQQLIAEADNKNVVFSDDLSSATRQQHLQGPQACQDDDAQHMNWNIALVNSQVLLKGCETKGYVILSAAKAEIVQRIHRPVWKECTLVSKTSWVGALECLQYYATVNAKENETANENIMWLTVDNIQEKESTVISEIPQVPNMVGSGVSVGAVVSDTVGGSAEDCPVELQRIVSRCKCEFFYVGYGDISVDPGTVVGDLPAPPQEDLDPFFRRPSAVNAFTLMHHDLDVCTNSLQYAMLLDIVNNLLLYVEPHRKEALERLARMRFHLQLQSIEDQRKPILILQTKVRFTLSRLRRLEKDTYLLHKALAEDPSNDELQSEINDLEKLVYECKTQLNAQAEELDMTLSCYKESQLLATSRLATTRKDKPLKVVRANEIFFKHAKWRLTEADGQIGIADLILSNFLYTKNSKSDDCVEHLLELGYLRMTNLLPNQIYEDVLVPTEIQSNMPVEHKTVVRIFCREKPPVGGISVKEHFEINVVPLTVALTKKFYNTMLRFCFPERDPDNIDGESNEELQNEISKGKKNRKRNRDSSFYIHIVDDVEKMKERAEKNKLFIYIKIPEVPVRLSYKGNKEKNLEDIRDFSLIIPTLEYHNVTWTWLDLLLAIRSDSRKVILSQAIKQKLQFKRNIGSSDESSSPHEEDKARMLFGSRHTAEMNKGTAKKSVFKFAK